MGSDQAWAPGNCAPAPHHLFTGGENKILRVHSLLAQGGRNGGTEGQGEGLLICLTRLWPKVSYHIPVPAGPLPSPKHGAVRKGKEWCGGWRGLRRIQNTGADSLEG